MLSDIAALISSCQFFALILRVLRLGTAMFRATYSARQLPPLLAAARLLSPRFVFAAAPRRRLRLPP